MNQAATQTQRCLVLKPFTYQGISYRVGDSIEMLRTLAQNHAHSGVVQIEEETTE